MDKPRYRLGADGSVRLVDGLQNVVAGLGTDRDKSALSVYVDTILDDRVLLSAYRNSWMARKIVDIPAFDACRRWRAWQAEADQIEAIEGEEKRLDLRRKVMQAKIAARLFGGAALLIGTRDRDAALPLDPDRMGAGGIEYITLLQRRHLSAGVIETDPASPYFDTPRSWRLSTAASSPEIHPSRLVMFYGNRVPDQTMAPAHFGWGEPILQGLLDTIRNLDATAANVAALVFEAKVDTIGIPDFMVNLGSPGYEEQILKRFRLAEIAKGINQTFIHDKEEELGQKQASFTALPDVLDRFMQLASGAADIPMTRLLGQSPAGMSATGDSDMRNYYDRVGAIQTLEIEPAMQLLDECLVRSALGCRPEEIHYNWHSLWQITDRERADIGKIQADTAKVLRETGLIPDEPLAEATVNMLTESGAMPGLESAVSAWIEGNPDEECQGETVPEIDPETGLAQGGGGLTAATQPSGTEPGTEPDTPPNGPPGGGPGGTTPGGATRQDNARGAAD